MTSQNEDEREQRIRQAKVESNWKVFYWITIVFFFFFFLPKFFFFGKNERLEIHLNRWIQLRTTFSSDRVLMRASIIRSLKTESIWIASIRKGEEFFFFVFLIFFFKNFRFDSFFFPKRFKIRILNRFQEKKKNFVSPSPHSPPPHRLKHN